MTTFQICALVVEVLAIAAFAAVFMRKAGVDRRWFAVAWSVVRGRDEG